MDYETWRCGAKKAPIRLVNTVTTLAAMNSSKVGGAVEVGILMGEVYIPTKWLEFVTQCVGFG